MANMRENEMIKHSGNKVTKQVGRQNYKTSGKTKLQNRRENKIAEQNIIYDFLPKKNVLSIFDANERKRN